MSKDIKAISTIIAGTIGVGFVALPYSLHKFGIIGGIVVLLIVCAFTVVTNIAYSEIIVNDKKNIQICGYTKLHLGEIPAHIITVVILLGSFGVLYAYGLLSGSALKVLLSPFDINVSSNFLSLIFIALALFVMRYGMGIISKVSTLAVLVLLLLMILLVGFSVPHIDLANLSPLEFDHFPFIYGVAIFAMYSAASIPVIDEIIGYNKRKFRKAILIANGVTVAIYIVFALVLSLSLGNSLTGELVDAFPPEQKLVSYAVSILVLVGVFTSFVLMSNSIKEILNYDYKIPQKTSLLIITTPLIWLIVLEFLDFETIVSRVGNIALVLQSVAIFAIWYRVKNKSNSIFKIIVGFTAIALIAGMLL
ncbi:MAG: aromatic amino acid transport family protein [Candidatus Dojkabacteria bacterium]|nr:aromatic amino acid transport family protein [Candidatus Dojkabacteria bacterium]